MSVWQRLRVQWRERDRLDEPPYSDGQIFFRPWWHPLNLLVILMPGFWGTIIGVVLGFAVCALIVAVPAVLLWELIFQ